jgi:anti-sigma B factor antagonist
METRLIIGPGLRPAPPPALHAAHCLVIGGWTVMELSGEIDCAAAGSVEWKLSGAIGPHCADLVVDLTVVVFLDAAGLHMLERAHARAGALGGGLRLVCPFGPVRDRIRMLSGERRLPIFADLGSAMAAGAPPHGSPGLRRQA